MGKRARHSRTLRLFVPLFLAAAAVELVEPARAAFPQYGPLIVLGMSALAIAMRVLTSQPLEPMRRRAPPAEPSQAPPPGE